MIPDRDPSTRSTARSASGSSTSAGNHDESPVHPAREDDLAGSDPREVIDVRGVAQLLAVGRNTVYALVARNAIPHRRLGKQIRFHRTAVMRWLASWSSQGAKEGQ